ELELRQRRLRLFAEIAVHRPGVEAELPQPLLHPLVEVRELSALRHVAAWIRNRLFRVQRSRGIRAHRCGRRNQRRTQGERDAGWDVEPSYHRSSYEPPALRVPAEGRAQLPLSSRFRILPLALRGSGASRRLQRSGTL